MTFDLGQGKGLFLQGLFLCLTTSIGGIVAWIAAFGGKASSEGETSFFLKIGSLLNPIMEVQNVSDRRE